MIAFSEYDFLRRFLKQRSGLILGDDKQYLLESRLEPVLHRMKVPDFSRLVALLRDGTAPVGLADAVVEAMTTNESLFFRDKNPFELLSSFILPELVAKRGPLHTIRIWCAAASTGQEPYSIAMLLKENERLLGGRRVEIVGTDLSSDVLARCEEGIYNQFEVQRGLPVHYLLRYFTQVGDNWRISPEIRSMVRFSRLNLLQPFGHLGTFDIVFCRNVLIYFDSATKSDVLTRIAGVTARDGYLILGGAETVLGLSSDFVAGSRRGFYVPRTSTGAMATAAK
ncbi:protein-glutamate O-methyltransferase CheR [Ancylobacter sp. WKF20]|uniref:CheR family methyltransferase n=1 Tax=Ancylobacter sp. WKF20 TaxID=3039801 RepID=UPI0024342404|nr:protein-glutamate O-methyltransferase CheR [Ancylobacter sp. WKF20]WGD28562.1 protein-glutamate O-methyltransferase CheR [Ancylobacter sp. WKF20]